MTRLKQSPLNILLADDDNDDCLLFKEALEELPISTRLTTVNNGSKLLQLLGKRNKQPAHVLFLDLNMPGKNGFVCLSEIKRHKKLSKLPVIILSTAVDQDRLNLTYKDAAHYYIRKPVEFSQLKDVIYKALTILINGDISLPGKERFLIESNL